jgi:sugar-phosphatase
LSIVKASAIIFDLDGVLANSIAILEESWAIWCAEKGLNFATVMNIAHGRRKSEILATVVPYLDPLPEIARIKQLEDDRVALVKGVSGASAFVSKVPAGKWAIGTSGERDGALARLRQVGIAPPAVLISSEDVDRGKPFPDVYLKAAAGLRIAPEECLVFEDAPAGVVAAHNAGMQAIALLTTYPADAFPGGVPKIQDFTRLSVSISGPSHSVQIEV